MPARMRLLALPAALISTCLAQQTVRVIPKEIHDVLVNPGMGIQTFQRFNGQAINAGLRWSEVGPEQAAQDAAQKVDFPDSSVAYFRWFWSQLEPQQGQYRWEIIDSALEEAHRHGQTLDIRLMPYDQSHPLPQWYRDSGARRINKPTDKDGNIERRIRCTTSIGSGSYANSRAATMGIPIWMPLTFRRWATGARAGDPICRTCPPKRP
jgi:hypothetical protein